MGTAWPGRLDGARVVFRHNTLTDAIWGNHGTESAGLLRGARSFEIYANTMTYTAASGPLPYAMNFRSANGVIWGNTMKGLMYGALYTDVYRDWSPFAPWGQCDGTSPFDQNDPMTYDTGTQTDGSGTMMVDGNITLTDATKGWTPNQWVGYSLHDTTRGDASIIVSNTATTITVRWDNTHNPNPLSFAMGDAYVIERAKVCLDQMPRHGRPPRAGHNGQPHGERVAEPGRGGDLGVGQHERRREGEARERLTAHRRRDRLPERRVPARLHAVQLPAPAHRRGAGAPIDRLPLSGRHDPGRAGYVAPPPDQDESSSWSGLPSHFGVKLITFPPLAELVGPVDARPVHRQTHIGNNHPGSPYRPIRSRASSGRRCNRQSRTSSPAFRW